MKMTELTAYRYLVNYGIERANLLGEFIMLALEAGSN
jgi:hypothetical protein